MHTQGWITQDQPNNDGQLFVSSVGGALSGAIAYSLLGATAYYGLLAPVSAATTINFILSDLLLRTGILNTSNFATNRSQEAFGTAAATPGPSSVAGTSGPFGLGPNQEIPPILAANLATLKGPQGIGAIAKGIQINWMDVLYQVLGGAATSITGALTRVSTAIGADVTPASSVLIAATALSTVVNSANTKIHRQRLTVAAPAMIVADGSTLEASIVATNPAGVTTGVAGIILGVSYNYN